MFLSYSLKKVLQEKKYFTNKFRKIWKLFFFKQRVKFSSDGSNCPDDLYWKKRSKFFRDKPCADIGEKPA